MSKGHLADTCACAVGGSVWSCLVLTSSAQKHNWTPSCWKTTSANISWFRLHAVWKTPKSSVVVVVVQLPSRVWLFVTPWTAARQASLSFTISQSLLKLVSTKSVMSCNHLILGHPLLLLPSVFPSNNENNLISEGRWNVITHGFTFRCRHNTWENFRVI